MSTKLVESIDGRPLFGDGPLLGWDVSTSEDKSTRERTLRNAALAAIEAESNGNQRLAHAIWTTVLDDCGGTVVALFCEGLPRHVDWLSRMTAEVPEQRVDAQLERATGTALAKAKAHRDMDIAMAAAAKAEDAAEREAIQEADPTPRSECVEEKPAGKTSPGKTMALASLDPNQVQHMIEQRASSLGRPVLHRIKGEGDKLTLLYEWPADGEWLAFNVDLSSRKAVQLRERPLCEQTSRQHRLAASSSGQDDPASAVSAVAQSNSMPAEAEVTKTRAIKIDMPSARAFTQAILESGHTHQGHARASANLRACTFCIAPINPGEKWIAKNKTTRQRVHLECFTPVAALMLAERKQDERTTSTSKGRRH